MVEGGGEAFNACRCHTTNLLLSFTPSVFLSVILSLSVLFIGFLCSCLFSLSSFMGLFLSLAFLLIFFCILFLLLHFSLPFSFFLLVCLMFLKLLPFLRKRSRRSHQKRDGQSECQKHLYNQKTCPCWYNLCFICAHRAKSIRKSWFLIRQRDICIPCQGASIEFLSVKMLVVFLKCF